MQLDTFQLSFKRRREREKKRKESAFVVLCRALKPKPPGLTPLCQMRAAMSSSSSASALAKAKSATSKFEAKGGGRSLPASSKAKRGKADKKVYYLLGQRSLSVKQSIHLPHASYLLFQFIRFGLVCAWQREPLRIFYESLSKQIPSSEMAEFWLMEHGLLSPERAKKAYDRKQKRQQKIRLGTPVKSSVKKDKPESWKKPITSHSVDSIAKAKKRVDYSDDDDFIIKMKRCRG